MDEKKIYETEVLNLMAFFQMNGLNYLGCKAKMGEERVRIVAQFEDPRGIGPELAMMWNNSEPKKFRDWWQYFRNEIDRHMKGINEHIK